MVVSFSQPALYSLTNNLIWPEVMHRARSHPEEVTWRDNEGGTALHHSCRSHYSVDVVREMLNSSRFAANIQDKSGKTPLHIACWTGASETIRLLIKTSKDVASMPDNRGRTPLHHACYSVSLPCAYTIETLIQADPRVSMVPDHAGKTPLSLLCERHRARLDAALANPRSDVYDTVLKPFWDQLRAILAVTADRQVLAGDWSLVHVVTSIPTCPQILFDLALKLHPEQVREKVYGSFPLHYAAQCPTGNVHVEHDDGYSVGVLLSLFPEASKIPDALGRLPLHLAITSGKSYRVVLEQLFQAFPDAIRMRDGNHYLLPFLLGALPRHAHNVRANTSSTQVVLQQVETVLELLRLDPSGVAGFATQ